MKTPLARTASFFVTFVLVLSLPWWVSAVLLLLLTIYFDFYLEVLFFGFLLDSLYFGEKTYIYPSLTIATISLLIISFVKTRIRT